MNKLRIIASLTALAVTSFIALPGLAAAADETITLQNSVVPRGGKLYKEKRVPVNTSLSVQVHTPGTSAKVNPLKRSVMKFPTDLTYNPNNRRTPVCPDSKLNQRSNLAAGVAAIVAICPRSVIGTGVAEIYIAKIHQPTALIGDPQLVIFNAGRDKHGNARMKIYAYSKTTNYGILMFGSLTKKGIENVFIPVLSNDSATASFRLDIPGSGIQVETDNGTETVKGLDPNYARSKCSSGKWTTDGTFTLGERAFPGGTDTGPETIVKATPFTMNCKGLKGNPRLKKARAYGPKRLRRGSRKVFKVKVKNTGTAVARGVKVKAYGSARGSSRMANIWPGQTRWTKVKARVTGRKGSKAKIVFRINPKNGRATKTVAWGRILRR
ncbi:MAG: hypothetical protein KDB54_12530 [Solirubrobacterales bacterium]|nr:hypothetical protein [Solirubrobacterales bacterium]